MKTKVAYVTTARSDYGPSYWVIRDLIQDDRFRTSLVVGGSHLSSKCGLTVQEIENDGLPISDRVFFLDDSDEDPVIERAVGRGAGRALTGFTDLFSRLRPDIVALYGDRHELLPIATAAVLTQTPIAHLCGGDLTEGAIDDQVRHAVTKMAHLHFPSSEDAAAKIRQMGEEPWRVHCVGDPSLDRFVRDEAIPVSALSRDLGFTPDHKTLLVTFHPPTLEKRDLPRQVAELVAALEDYDGPIVITAPAPDAGQEFIRAALQEFVRCHPQARFVESLGNRRYWGLMRVVGAMVGNSSSGLNDAPCIPLPVVNIGRRQDGRLRGANVLDVAPQRQAIAQAIQTALRPEFRAGLQGLNSPYGDGHASERIVRVLADLPARNILLQKQFRLALDRK